MKALRTSGERQVDVLDLPVPKPAPDEVIVQMKATGICGSDLHPYRHPTPQHLDPGFISGHEPCGVISELRAGVRFGSCGSNARSSAARPCSAQAYSVRRETPTVRLISVTSPYVSPPPSIWLTPTPPAERPCYHAVEPSAPPWCTGWIWSFGPAHQGLSLPALPPDCQVKSLRSEPRLTNDIVA